MSSVPLHRSPLRRSVFIPRYQGWATLSEVPLLSRSGQAEWHKTKADRATGSEPFPNQCLEPPTVGSNIPSEEHCVPEAGMQWHNHGQVFLRQNSLNHVAMHIG